MAPLRPSAPPGPTVAVGVPLYNGGLHVEPALASLLAQSYRDVGFVLVDDGSTDGSAEVAERLAAADERVRFASDGSRLGLVGNWRRAFDLAGERFPGARYFAWASDHDEWDPRWLEALVGALEANPSAVLAYSRNHTIHGDGLLPTSWHFSTAGVRSRRERFRLACDGLEAGNMVYGLFRRDALEQAGGFPLLLGPDRLLLIQLSLAGEFVEVSEPLWRRRVTGRTTRSRQRAAFFPGRRAPAWSYLPPWLQHAAALLVRLSFRRHARPSLGRGAGALYALYYLVHGLVEAGRRTAIRTRKRSQRLRKEGRRRYRQRWKETREGLRVREKCVRRTWKRRRKLARRRIGAIRDRLRRVS